MILPFPARSLVPPYAQDYIQLKFVNSDIDRYIESARDEFEAKLREWVEIPTISAEPDHKTDIDRGADAAVQYLRSLGADAEKVANLSSLAAERTAPLVSQSPFCNPLADGTSEPPFPPGRGNFYREPVEFRLCSGRGQAITA